MAAGLRLMIYDRTCRGRGLVPGLGDAWWLGGALYARLDRLDAHRGVTSWAEGLRFLAEHRPQEPVAEVQFWGHGKWGEARVGAERLDSSALAASHPLRRDLDALRARLLPDARSLLWFRTCETLGAVRGQDFARRLADDLGCRVAGHTFIIGFFQSGLHALSPGRAPAWSPREGLREGSPEAPRRARWSGPTRPRTITCLHGDVPAAWLDG